MARILTTEQDALLSARGVTKCELIKLGFDTPMYLTTAGRNVTHDSKVWLGDGTLLGISDIEESLEIQSTAMQLELSGANASLVALALLGLGKGKQVQVWVAALNAAGSIQGTPSLEADLQIDTMPVIDGVE
ncbi:MAG: hypothetical protein AB7N70_13890 [Dehalococcoidia bacterium]